MVFISRSKALRSLGHRVWPCKRRHFQAAHLETFRFLRKISGNILCPELNRFSVLAVFSFLRKPPTKPTIVIFPASFKQQSDCCQKPEQYGVTDISSFVLTFLSSASLKGKWTEKHIQRYKSPLPLRSEMGEEPCWEIPHGTWCCLFSPGLIYQWRETGREAPARFLFIFGLAAESVGPVPSCCHQCAWVTLGGLWAGLLDFSSCRAGNNTWKFFFSFLFSFESCPWWALEHSHAFSVIS